MASPGVFELEPVVEPSALPSGVKIATVELCENSLYIGSNEGSIIKYVFGEDNMHSALSIHREKSRELGPVSTENSLFWSKMKIVTSSLNNLILIFYFSRKPL